MLEERKFRRSSPSGRGAYSSSAPTKDNSGFVSNEKIEIGKMIKEDFLVKKCKKNDFLLVIGKRA